MMDSQTQQRERFAWGVLMLVIFLAALIALAWYFGWYAPTAQAVGASGK